MTRAKSRTIEVSLQELIMIYCEKSFKNRDIDETMQTIETLLKEAKPDADVLVMKPEVPSEYIDGYNQAIDDYEKNIKELLR